MNEIVKTKRMLVWVKKYFPFTIIFTALTFALGYLFFSILTPGCKSGSILKSTSSGSAVAVYDDSLRQKNNFDTSYVWHDNSTIGYDSLKKSDSLVENKLARVYRRSAKRRGNNINLEGAVSRFSHQKNRTQYYRAVEDEIDRIYPKESAKGRENYRADPDKNSIELGKNYDAGIPGMKTVYPISPASGRAARRKRTASSSSVLFGDNGPSLKHTLPSPLDEPSFQPARIAYGIPEAMKVDKPYRVVVSITASMKSLILYNGLDPTNMKDEELLVTKLVRVNLIEASGENNFSIKNLATERQTVDDTTNTVWRWDVIPLRRGTYNLMIRATVQTGKESEKDITAFERTVQVQAEAFHDAKKFISAYWQFLLTAIVIPSFIWGYKHFISKNKRKNVDDSVYV